MGDVITDLEKFKQGWTGGLPETPCGIGSTMRKTKPQREWIPQIIEKYNIKTIADIGAGDLNWIKHTNLNGCTYTPYDLVPRHPEIIQFDIIKQIPPKVDLIICLWVLNHLTFNQCRKALHNIKQSGAEYLLMSDRPKWHDEQPPEIIMPYIDRMILNEANDNIQLVKL